MKKNIFNKIYLLYIFILLIISIIFLTYVYKCLISYERNFPINYVKYTLNNLSDLEITQLFNINNDYESDSLKNIKNYLKSDDYDIKKVADLSYDIYNKNDKILKVTLKSNETVKKLGLLTFDLLEKESVEKIDNNGLFSYNIFMPSGYEMQINGKNLKEKNLVEDAKLIGYEDVYDEVNLPTLKKYDIKYLTKEPTFVAKNAKGETINVIVNDNNICISDNKKYNNLNEAGLSVDVIKFAKDWSLFMSKDLSGTYYGFNNIIEYFIKNKIMYQKAYEWSHGVDITFTSKHTLKNPIFTNENISNVVIYDDNAFSCDVYLEKNMVIAGKEHIDVQNNTIYYIKINDTWKVANLKAVVK